MSPGDVSCAFKIPESFFVRQLPESPPLGQKKERTDSCIMYPRS